MEGRQQEAFAEEALPPETDVQGEDVKDLAGGELRVPVHNLHAIFPVFIGRSYGGMVCKENLGIRDDAGKKEGMGSTAERTLYPADGQGHFPQGCLYGTGIVSMANETATMAAGALHLAYLDGIHSGIIKFL